MEHKKNTKFEKNFLKFIKTDAKKRKCGYRTGLETQVVYTIKYKYLYIVIESIY